MDGATGKTAFNRTTVECKLTFLLEKEKKNYFF